MKFYCIGILLFTGLYALLFSRNMIRLLIGLQIVIKAITLLLVSIAHLTGSVGLGQSMFITMMVIEVVMAVMILAFIVNVHGYTESLDVRSLTRLRG